jgi:hypothetical protein
MSDADLFRQYAKEAMHGSSKVMSENEKQTLIDLACYLGASSVFLPHATLAKPHRAPALDLQV